MKRLAPGCRIVRADGRHMEIRAVTDTDGIRVVWWRQVSELTPEQAAERLALRLAGYRVAKYGAQALRETYAPDEPWYANTGHIPAQTRIVA